MTSADSVLKVFLFTDIVGSLDLKQRLGDAAAAQAIARHDALFRRLLSEHEGIENDNAGDGFSTVFERPSDALRCALDFQKALKELESPEPFQVRIGIHLGETTALTDVGGSASRPKFVGLAIDMAARITALAHGGQVLLTRAAFDSARQHVQAAPDGAAVVWLAHGPYRIKGLEEPIEVFEAGVAGLSPLSPPADSEKAKRAVAPGEEETLGWRPAVGLPVPARMGWSLERKLGEGGFGEVWIARHEKTREPRTFKFCFKAERLRTLKRELTLFRLLKETLGERPDIARLYDVQLESAPFFLEMDYTAGGDLAAWAERQGGIGAVPLATRLELVAQVAEALAAAHSVGVIHKDVKPTNVLIEERKDGTIQAKLTDFGIGQLVSREALEALSGSATGFTEGASTALTDLGSRTGTRLYMAPELLAGKPPTIQSDVYALGVVFYQMVVPDLSRPLGQGWERDVEDELLRDDIAACVDGVASRRLPSALELAQRLRGIQRRRAEREAQEQAIERARRAKRRRGLLIGGLAAALILFVAVSIVALREARLRTQAEASRQETARALSTAETQRQAAIQAREAAEAERRRANEQSLVAMLNDAARHIAEGRYSSAEEALLAIPPELRNWEWGYLMGQAHPELLTLQASSDAWDGAFSADGSKIFKWGPRTAQSWEASSGRELITFDHGNNDQLAAFSPRSMRVAFFKGNGFLAVWDCASGKRLSTFEHDGLVNAAFDQDGTRLVTTSYERTAKVWDVARAEAILTLGGHSGSVLSAAFSPDGTRLVTTTNEGTAKLWDAHTGRELGMLPGRGNLFAQFSADGSRILTSGGGAALRAIYESSPGRIRIYDSTRLSELASFTDDQRLDYAEFSPDASRVVSVSETIIVRDALTGKIAWRVQGHRGVIVRAQWSGDGRRILTNSRDGTSKLWDAQWGRELLNIRGNGPNSLICRLSPDGTVVLAVTDNSVALWDAATGRLKSEFENKFGYEEGSRISRYSFSPDGNFLLMSAAANTVKLRDVATCLELGTFQQLSRPSYLGFSPRGTYLAIGTSEGAVQVWETATQASVLSVEPADATKIRLLGVAKILFSPDERRVFAACWDGSIKSWDLGSGRELASMTHDGLLDAALLKSGESLPVTASKYGTVNLWDLSGNAQSRTLDGLSAEVLATKFNSDGDRLMATLADGSAGIWDVADGRLLSSLAPVEGRVHFASFSQDGTRVLGIAASPRALQKEDQAATTETLAILWDARSGSKLLAIGRGRKLSSADLSPDGARLVTGSSDGTLALWNAQNGRELLTLTGSSSGILGASFSPDGSTLLTDSTDGTVRLWRSTPWLDEKLPGDARLGWQERFRLWQSQRYALWSKLQISRNPVPVSTRDLRPLFADDFESQDSLARWNSLEKWELQRGGVQAIRQERGRTAGFSVLETGPLEATDYAVEVDVELPTNSHFIVLARCQSLGSRAYKAIALVYNAAGLLSWRELPRGFITGSGRTPADTEWTPSGKFRVRIEARGDRFIGFIDGKYIGQYEAEGFEKGSCGLAYWHAYADLPARYDNFAVYPLTVSEK